MIEKLMYNIEQLGEFGGLSMYIVAYILDLYKDNLDTLQQHCDLWQSFNICWLSTF